MRRRVIKPANPSTQPVPNRLQRQIDEVDNLLTDDRPWDALAMLRDLNEQRHNVPAVLNRMAIAAALCEDFLTAESAMEQLVRLEPNRRRHWKDLATYHSANGRYFLSLSALQTHAERWPNVDESSGINEMIEAFGADCLKYAREAGYPPGREIEIGAWHDRIGLLLDTQHPGEARAELNRQLAELPHDVRSLNNLAGLEIVEGNLHAALVMTRKALAHVPDNSHALGNAVRIHVMMGSLPDAVEAAARLKAAPIDASESHLKALIALSFLADDEAILDIYRRAMDSENNPSTSYPIFHHLAAVAACRLERMDEARALWKRALDLDPEFTLTLENLNDLRKPVEQRHAPWAFNINEWIHVRVSRELKGWTEGGMAGRSEDDVHETMVEFVRSYPEMEGVIPLLLDRGDPAGRELAMMIAVNAATPRLIDALAAFARSHRGPDSTRLEALAAAQKAGGHFDSQVKFWARGKEVEGRMFGTEITPEPTVSIPPVAESLVNKARQYFRTDPSRAEKYLREAITKAPDFPSFHYNLAMTRKLQGFDEEAMQMLEEIHARFPDYWFAAIQLAEERVHQGRLEEAERLINDFELRPKLHLSEFRALASAHISLSLARNDRESAEYWLGSLERVMPDDPNIEFHRQRIRGSKRKKPPASRVRTK